MIGSQPRRPANVWQDVFLLNWTLESAIMFLMGFEDAETGLKPRRIKNGYNQKAGSAKMGEGS
jgi:hypothetical protein